MPRLPPVTIAVRLDRSDASRVEPWSLVIDDLPDCAKRRR